MGDFAQREFNVYPWWKAKPVVDALRAAGGPVDNCDAMVVQPIHPTNILLMPAADERDIAQTLSHESLHGTMNLLGEVVASKQFDSKYGYGLVEYNGLSGRKA